MTNAKIRAGAKDWYIDHIEDYEDARDEAFYEEFKEMFTVEGKLAPFSLEDCQEFIDNFDFPEEADWIANEYESFIGGLQDAEYDRMRDER